MNWQGMDSAPKDGTAFQAEIPGHGSDNVIAWCDGLLNEWGDDCGGWHFVSEQEPPECWTDGVCWEANEEGNPSTPPIRWKHLPSASAGAGGGAMSERVERFTPHLHEDWRGMMGVTAGMRSTASGEYVRVEVYESQAERINELEAERDRQYEQNAEQIIRIAELEAQQDDEQTPPSAAQAVRP